MSEAEQLWDTVRDMPHQELLGFREKILSMESDAPSFRALCGSYIPEGFLCWLSLFGWTYNPRLEEKHQPFIPWRIQEVAARKLWNAVAEGRDALIDKSRDMGASWLCLAVLFWFWQFVPDTPILVASRKEEYVDKAGNPDTLFWKLDYLYDRQADFLRPNRTRTYMHMRNDSNGSVISGESTNTDLARGGRRKAILLDEFAAVENGVEILAATADATPCRLFNSTPKGRGNAFADVRFSGKVDLITLHWHEHPEKGKGAKEVEVDGKLRWTSPWYRSECARRVSKKEIAQELDIDYLASGDAVFDLDVLQRIRAGGTLIPPLSTGALRFKVDTRTEGRSYRVRDVEWAPRGRGPLALWCPLGPDSRPSQKRNYVAFCDISAGTGASNSVCKVFDVSSREEVGQLCTPDMSPDEFADNVVALCKWFGGTKSVYLGWESNGPGLQFGRRVHRLGYWSVLGNQNILIPWEPSDNKVGWHSSRDSKSTLLADLDGSLARGELTLHDEAAVTEMEQYIVYPSGAVGPSKMVEENEGARKAHGDRVIALAGILLTMSGQPSIQARPKVPEPGSMMWRKKQRERRELEALKW